jgi:hypothetical protein
VLAAVFNERRGYTATFEHGALVVFDGVTAIAVYVGRWPKPRDREWFLTTTDEPLALISRTQDAANKLAALLAADTAKTTCPRIHVPDRPGRVRLEIEWAPVTGQAIDPVASTCGTCDPYIYSAGATFGQWTIQRVDTKTRDTWVSPWASQDKIAALWQALLRGEAL